MSCARVDALWVTSFLAITSRKGLSGRSACGNDLKYISRSSVPIMGLENKQLSLQQKRVVCKELLTSNNPEHRLLEYQTLAPVLDSTPADLQA